MGSPGPSGPVNGSVFDPLYEPGSEPYSRGFEFISPPRRQESGGLWESATLN